MPQHPGDFDVFPARDRVAWRPVEERAMAEFDWMRLVYLLLVLALIGPAALALGRGRLLSHAAAWLGVLVLLVLLYRAFGG
jgi:hypothetical protein